MNYLTFSQLERVGRLGNGLWQIASTIGLARRHGMEPRFPPGWSYRKWFCIPDAFFEDVRGTEAYRLPDLDHMDERTRVYLQDLSLWANVEDEIREYFKPSRAADVAPPSLEFMVVHVRRGDNVNQQDCYPLPSMRYYLDAIGRHPDLPVMVYGDDVDWNMNELKPRAQMFRQLPVMVIGGIPRPKEHEPNYMTAPIFDWVDLFAMARGSAFCLSNSTMGWWSAWLSGSDDVCYPKPWFGPALDIHQDGYIDASLMFPGGWMEIEAS